jgi:tetratricopeptide (TPR) repeat protein
LGAVYLQQKKWPEAIAQYEKAIGLLRQALTSIDSDKIAQHEKAMSLKHDLALIYLNLGSSQLTYAYSKQPAFGNVNELGTNELEAFRASIKQAIDNIDRAKEHGYNHPNLYITQGRALAFQSNYQEAVNRVNIYFEKVNELEKQLPPLAKKCNSGFNLLNANGYWWLGDFYYLEGSFEADEQKKTELFNKAAEQFKQAIKLKQDFDVAYLMLGSIYDTQKKYEDSISQYQNAIRFGTNKTSKAQAYGSIGGAYGKLKHYDEAMRSIQEAIKLDPNNPSLYESLASIYVAQGNIEETFKLLKKAAELRTELKMEPAADSSPYYYLGGTYTVRFLQKGNEEDFNEAVKWLKKAIEISPKNATYYQALGITYEKHSNVDEAMANYKKAVEYDPKDPSNYFNMAEIYSLKHNYDAAIERIRQVIEFRSDYAKAYQYLGKMYHHKNDDTEAIKQELKAISIDPKYLQAYLDLAEIYKTQKKYSEAIKYLQSAIGIAPTNFQPYKELAKVYEEQQKNEDAIHYYEEVINLIDADDSLKNLYLWTKNVYLGRIERLRGHYAEAIAYFQKLPQPTSETPGQTQYEIGLTYIASKNKSAALEQHRQLVQLKSPLADELLKRIKEMK